MEAASAPGRPAIAPPPGAADARPDGGRGKGHFSWVFRLERSILMTGWVQCGSEVRYVLKSRFNTPLTV